MTDSIADILSKSRRDEPAEVAIIKKFLMDKYKSESKVTVQPTQIVIGVASSSLAGALRMHLHELQQLCQTDKRLVIRIG